MITSAFFSAAVSLVDLRLADDRLLAVFVVFFAADFFDAVFLAVDFFAAVFFAAVFLAAVFLAAVLFAAVFLAVVFFADDFLAAVRLVAFFAVDFFGTAFSWDDEEDSSASADVYTKAVIIHNFDSSGFYDGNSG